MKLRERGQAAIEFALAVPFLLMFVFFISDMALLGYSYVSVTNAVREGARCAAVGGTDDAVETRVQNTSGGLANFSTASVTARDAFVGGDVTVEAEYEYDWITPVGLVPGMAGTLDFTKSVTMRTEVAEATKAVCAASP
jgi:Flp pilus assembly protein TadG